MIERVDGGVQTSTVGAAAPVVGWACGPLGLVQAADREIARQTALKARAVAEFAESRPADVDRAQGERGAMSAERWAARAEVLRPVSEWVTAELAIALNLTRPGAEALLAESLTLVHGCPRRWPRWSRGGRTGVICGLCWTRSPRSPTTSCAGSWRPICWPGRRAG